MAKCQGEISAKELISDTFKPRIAVLSSPGAQAICQKNNLKFTHLIQPFATLTTEAVWQEPNGLNIFPKNLKLSLVDIASWKPPDSDVKNSRKVLSTIVSNSPPNFTQSNGAEGEAGGDHCKSIKLRGVTAQYSVSVPSVTPWYYTWRQMFLKGLSERNLLHHEFLNNFNACILVISSSEGKTPEDLAAIIAKLIKLQQQHQYEWPNSWIFPSILKFYLLVHDNSAEKDSSGAEAIYQSLRTTYGGNFCHLLKINSGGEDVTEGTVNPNQHLWDYLFDKDYQRKRSISDHSNSMEEKEEPVVSPEIIHPLSPDSEYAPSFAVSKNGEVEAINTANEQEISVSPHTPVGKFLTSSDLQNIQIAINEFIGKALFPYIERQARILYESILNRRGMSKSILSATKRLFGTSAKPLSANSAMYTLESAEMISRKLADLYFLFGNYTGSYQFYHQLKKDFQADAAWVYYASALEMAAISHFMMTHSEYSNSKAFPLHYVNESLTFYMDHCRMSEAATRCAILCSECLKFMENYGDAAALLIRMTSEDSDLRSALILEQAAYCFLKLNSPRKYAFHSVLAGHRYSKAGLKFHSLNCYLQAYQVYCGRGWKFAADHVYSTISRLSGLHLIKTDSSFNLNQSQPPLPSQIPPPSPRIAPNAKFPLDFYFKFDFSHLKYASSTVLYGILRASNSSEKETINIERIEFDPPELIIEEFGVGEPSIQCSSFPLEPLESRNIMLKIIESPLIKEDRSQNQMLLCIHWKNGDGKAGSQRIKVRDLKRRENPFVFHLRHEPKYLHDFKSSPCFITPVQMTIYSRESCDIKLELNKIKEEDNGLSHLPPSNYVYFVGQTSWSLHFDSSKTQKLTFNIAVTQPGIHNIGPAISIIHSNSNPDGKRTFTICSPLIIQSSE